MDETKRKRDISRAPGMNPYADDPICEFPSMQQPPVLPTALVTMPERLKQFKDGDRKRCLRTA